MKDKKNMRNDEMTDRKRLKKVRVMFIIDFLYTLSGGTENQLVKIIKNLDRNKYDLHLLTLRESMWIKNNRRKLNCIVRSYHVDKLKNPGNILLFIRLVKYIRQIAPDIVVTFFPLSNIFGVIAARFAKVTSIISTRRDYGLWLNKRSIYSLRFANRFIKGIVSNSQSVKELTSVEEHVESSKIRVIYNGLDIHDFRSCKNRGYLMKKELGILPDSKVVGIVANLRPMKRHETFLKSAKFVLKVRPDVNFVIVGDGPLRTDIEALTAKLGIKDYVHLVGRQEDVLPFLSIFDIGVNCSANEGLSNAIMEYMAYGVPCIVSKAGGNSELIENGINGHTFELDNHKELAERILNLLDDKEKQEKFASNSREKILNQLTIDKMINEYDNYFIQMLEGNRFS